MRLPSEGDAILVGAVRSVCFVVSLDELGHSVQPPKLAHGVSVFFVKGELHQGSHRRPRMLLWVVFLLAQHIRHLLARKKLAIVPHL